MIRMNSRALTLVIALLFPVIVESQRNLNPPPLPEFSPLPPRLPPPLSPEPPSPPLTLPSPLTRPPPLTPPPHVSPPPRFAPPPLPLPPPPASLTPPPPFSQTPQAPLQSWPHSQPPPPPGKHLRPALPEHGNRNSYKNLSPPLEREKPNMGKKIGLMFIGVAAILQVCIVAFLLIRRRQLLKSVNGY